MPVNRHRTEGPDALEDRSRAPTHKPTRLALWVIEAWRREHRWFARRVTREVADARHVACSICTRPAASGWTGPAGADIEADGCGVRDDEPVVKLRVAGEWGRVAGEPVRIVLTRAFAATG